MSDYTEKFHSEFPDGVVPMDRPPRLGDGPVLDELIKKVQGHDRVHAAFNVPTLDQLRTSYLHAISLGMKNVGVGGEYLIAMMREGLTLRQIARYVGQPPAAMLAHDLTHYKSWGRTEAWLQADELFLAGGSVKGVARATGLAITTARFIRDLRGVRCAA